MPYPKAQMEKTQPSDSLPPLRLAVLISGSGRTLVNIQKAIDKDSLNAVITCVISSRDDVQGIVRAKELGHQANILVRKAYTSNEDYSQALFDVIRQAEAELVVLAGWLNLLQIPEDYHRRVINIHPALLPKFGGKGMFGHHVHQAVIDAGENQTGCTVHFADNSYDTGPIIARASCPVSQEDDADTLAARVFELETQLYPCVLQAFSLAQVWESPQGLVILSDRPDTQSNQHALSPALVALETLDESLGLDRYRLAAELCVFEKVQLACALKDLGEISGSFTRDNAISLHRLQALVQIGYEKSFERQSALIDDLVLLSRLDQSFDAREQTIQQLREKISLEPRSLPEALDQACKRFLPPT